MKKIKKIIEIFGKPNYPTLLTNSELFLSEGTHIPIGNVYLFDKNHFLKLLKFGEPHVNGLIFSRERIVGYFYCDRQEIIMADNAEKIIGNIGDKITYEINEISFIKKNLEGNFNENYFIMKFLASNLRINL